MTDPINPAESPPQVLRRGAADFIAYHRTAGRGPGVVFLGGFMSDMTGTKAAALEAFCRERGYAFLRFDYSGHGASSGAFVDGTIGKWTGDALAVLDALTEGPQILVGSSMGGWIMLLVAMARPERVAGLVGVAAAPDFTEDLIWGRMNEAERAELLREGVFHLKEEEGEAVYPVTRALIEDGRTHLLLRGPIPVAVPVALVHGMQDRDAPFEISIRLADRLASRDVTVTLVKDGGHRMSEPRHLAHLFEALQSVLRRAS